MSKKEEQFSWYVYIVECKDGTYYTGVSNDIKHRIKQHNLGKGARYTRARGPVNLVYSEKCSSRSAASKRECEIKKLTRSQKKDLIFPSKTKKIKVGLALGSGGWRGLAHIGIIKALLKHNLPIDIIVGSSTGALVGGYYAATQNIDLVEETLSNIKSRDIWSIFGDPRPRKAGLLKGERFENAIKRYVGQVQIEKLPIKFAATAVDFKTGKAVVLDTGDMTTAIRASTSVPFIFQPLKRNQMLLIDGGTKTPVPVKIARSLGADVVIAVNLYKNVFPVAKGRYGPMQVALKTTHLLLHELAAYNCALADITLLPDVLESKRYSIFKNIVGNSKVVQAGEEAVEKQLTQIRKIIKSSL